MGGSAAGGGRMREWNDGGETKGERVHGPLYAAVIGENLEVGTVL